MTAIVTSNLFQRLTQLEVRVTTLADENLTLHAQVAELQRIISMNRQDAERAAERVANSVNQVFQATQLSDTIRFNHRQTARARWTLVESRVEGLDARLEIMEGGPMLQFEAVPPPADADDL